MNICIIGIGLIGGSLAIDLKKNGFASWIIGVDNNPKHANEALQLGLVDEILPIEDALQNVNLVIIAVPVNQVARMLPRILDQVDHRTFITDMGSTKSNICNIANAHPKRQNFVASHPIAGTENNGPGAAFSGLFKDKMTIICEKEKSNNLALKLVEKMYQGLEMRTIYMEPEAHDQHLAYVSHLSHVSSFTLGLTVLDIEKTRENIFNLAGSGFASTVRLAHSSPDMWAPIFNQNADHLSEALGAYISHLQNFKNLIDNHEEKKLNLLMKRANGIGAVLQGSEE